MCADVEDIVVPAHNMDITLVVDPPGIPRVYPLAVEPLEVALPEALLVLPERSEGRRGQRQPEHNVARDVAPDVRPVVVDDADVRPVAEHLAHAPEELRPVARQLLHLAGERPVQAAAQVDHGRALLLERVAMTADTVFDIASLTKPIATAYGGVPAIQDRSGANSSAIMSLAGRP
jgi:hypothetical protein